MVNLKLQNVAQRRFVFVDRVKVCLTLYEIMAKHFQHFKITKGSLFNLEEGCFFPRKEAVFSIIGDKSRKSDWN